MRRAMGSRAPFEAALYPQTQRVLYRHASTRATRQPPDERTRAFGRAPGALSRARRVAPGVQTGAPCGAGDVGARVEARRARESPLQASPRDVIFPAGRPLPAASRSASRSVVPSDDIP